MQNTQYPPSRAGALHPVAESNRSAVSWGAVIAGAAIGAALSAMLITGGTGLGFLAVSPWQNEGASGATLAAGTIVWLLLTQIIAFGIAGYVAGRLRTRWTDAASDEIYFRDTAHGLLVWAVSAIVSLVVLGSAVASIASGTARTGAALVGAGAGAATIVAGQAAGAADELSLHYFTDTLLRRGDPSNTFEREGVRGEGDVRQEVSTILLRSLVQGELSDGDRSYLVQLIAERAGVDEATARQRLAQTWEHAGQTMERAEQEAREAADAARKAAAAFSLWAFISLLIGAFVASFAATVGGRARDS